MPYMQCNGRTVSRHSSTPEVQQCKAAEKKAYAEQHTKCMASVECRADREFKHDVSIVFCLIIGVLIAAMMGVVFEVLNTELDEYD